MNKALDMITLWLLIIGGLNWGLVGLGWWLGSADWNVVHMILGNWMMVEGLVYILVGLSGVYVAWMSVSKKSM
ncbi:MAG: DUF378 domain-containing protein [Candidatus Staskawiczbacteria bacterium]|nr:DUF378 domain-containing protein [Candidatus Staskawiczbacteria bacterium]